MNISEAANLCVERCFNNGKVRSISPTFNTKYTFGDKEIVFTKAVLEEMKRTNRIRVISENEKSAFIMGIAN